MVYAANHVFFSFIVGTFSAGPIGVAASPDILLATQFCDPELLSINCVGHTKITQEAPRCYQALREKSVLNPPSSIG